MLTFRGRGLNLDFTLFYQGVAPLQDTEAQAQDGVHLLKSHVLSLQFLVVALGADLGGDRLLSSLIGDRRNDVVLAVQFGDRGTGVVLGDDAESPVGGICSEAGVWVNG